MLLFKPFHIDPILSGLKTETRRMWKKPRANVGAIHRCQTQMFTKDYFAQVKILKVYQERLGDIKRSDYRDEGGCTKETFIKAWTGINGNYDPDLVVYVIKFELVKEKVI